MVGKVFKIFNLFLLRVSLMSIVRIEKDWLNLLCEHYDSVFYYDGVEYRLRNVFMTKKFSGFNSEEEFRGTLKEFKPLFIMNSVMNILLLDFDFKLKVYTDDVLKKSLNYVLKTVDYLKKMIDVNDFTIVYSGRGYHLYIETPVIDRVFEVYNEVGMSLTTDWVSTLNRIVVSVLIKKMGKEYPVIKKVLDPSSGASGKMVRTPLSINDKNFMPVVPVTDYDDFGFDYLINFLTEPRRFKVKLKTKIPVRVGPKYVISDSTVVDEYELLKLLFKHNVLVDDVREVTG